MSPPALAAMSDRSTLAKWSLSDYHQMIAAGILRERHVELLQGDITEMPPEGELHAYTSSTVAEYLRQCLGQRASVRENHPITLPTTQSEPQPDIAIVEPLGSIYREHHPYPENIYLLIEFAQTSFAKDNDLKARLYAAAAISEYWLVALPSLTITIMRTPMDGVYQSRQTISTGSIFPLAFPDLEISLKDLLD